MNQEFFFINNEATTTTTITCNIQSLIIFIIKFLLFFLLISLNEYWFLFWTKKISSACVCWFDLIEYWDENEIVPQDVHIIIFRIDVQFFLRLLDMVDLFHCWGIELNWSRKKTEITSRGHVSAINDEYVCVFLFFFVIIVAYWECEWPFQLDYGKTLKNCKSFLGPSRLSDGWMD